MSPAQTISVGIATRNRLDSLVRCVKSLEIISDLVHEVIVIDDHSDDPVEEPLRRRLTADFTLPVKVVRHDKNHGPIAARNLIANLSKSELILSLDDDAALLESEGVRDAIKIMGRDERIGAVAFAQANKSGEPWPARMQPSPVQYPCYTTAFIGFAVLLRRDRFLSLGGYRTLFHFYGEEKEYCLRLLSSGSHVLYLPDAKVGHFPDPSGRSSQKYIRYAIRNDCFGAVYNQPLPLMLLSLGKHFYGYFRMRQHSESGDPGGFMWITQEIRKCLPDLWRERRPLPWATFRRWSRIKTLWPRYDLNE